MKCVWETESLKSQIHWARRGKKGVLAGERLGTPRVDVHGGSSLVMDRGHVWLWEVCRTTDRDRRLGPFKAPLPTTKPQACAEEDMHY